MNESVYLAAKGNRERRANLETHRQETVTLLGWLRANSHGARPLLKLPETQREINVAILSEALALWEERAKGQVLKLDQEFTNL